MKTQRPKHLVFYDRKTNQTYCICLPRIITPEFVMDLVAKLLGHDLVGLLLGCRNRAAAVRSFEGSMLTFHSEDLKPKAITLPDLN